MNFKETKNNILNYIEDVVVDFLGMKHSDSEIIIEDNEEENIITIITVDYDNCYIILEDMDISSVIEDYPQLDKFKSTISFFLQKNLYEGHTVLDLNGLNIRIE